MALRQTEGWFISWAYVQARRAADLQRDRGTGARQDGTAAKQVNKAKRSGRETVKQASRCICWVGTFLRETRADTDGAVPAGTAKELPLRVIVTAPLNVILLVSVIIVSLSPSVQINLNEGRHVHCAIDHAQYDPP